MKKISIIIPAHNEEGNVSLIYQRIRNVFSKLEHYTFEIIFVNDGSRDSTQSVLEQYSRNFDNVKFIEFSRNFGHQPAVKAGMDHADGNAVVSMDADLQHPPELIPELIQKWEEGFDVVLTNRKYPKEISYFKKKTSEMFYRFLSRISDVDLKSGGGSDFRLLDSGVVQEFRNFTEDDLFLRGLTSWMGFRQKNDEVCLHRNHRIQRQTIVSCSLSWIYVFSIFRCRLRDLRHLFVPRRDRNFRLGFAHYDHRFLRRIAADYSRHFRNLSRQDFQTGKRTAQLYYPFKKFVN
jgi:glycosyltransferase involved in cell wall biosynthesis